MPVGSAGEQSSWLTYSAARRWNSGQLFPPRHLLYVVRESFTRQWSRNGIFQYGEYTFPPSTQVSYTNKILHAITKTMSDTDFAKQRVMSKIRGALNIVGEYLNKKGKLYSRDH